MNERLNVGGKQNEDAAIEQPRIPVDLPELSFGASEMETIQTLVDKIEEIPLDEQEPYWQIMDNKDFELQEKVSLINDLLRQYNGDVQE